MDVVYEERDGGTTFKIYALVALFPSLLAQLMVKFDQKQGLVLDGGEEVVVSNEIEHVGTTQSNEERQSFSVLSIGHVPDSEC